MSESATSVQGKTALVTGAATGIGKAIAAALAAAGANVGVNHNHTPEPAEKVVAGTAYGLTAAICTTDVARAGEIARRLEVGPGHSLFLR
jgi:3-oxoacyl-[acyl-carrier protein] reductase